MEIAQVRPHTLFSIYIIREPALLYLSFIHLRKSLNESGFFFVTKEPFPSPHMHFLKNVS